MERKDTEEPFEIFDYTFDRLTSLLAEKSLPRSVLSSGKILSQALAEEKPHILAAKYHCKSLENYFENKPVNAKTILSENRYVDVDYLKDHTEYYNRCFRRYNRHCVRLHFFSSSFKAKDFYSLISGQDSPITQDNLQENYLGFIVVKPLPKTFIGRTCLVPKGNANLDCKFPAVREYLVNLFGIPLSVSSLAFQEQDNVVAACATSALWSLYHKTGLLFQHKIPSPSEITKKAQDNEINIVKKGLLPEEINRSIRTVKLDPFTVEATQSFHFRAYIYSYLTYGIPIFMGHWLYDTTKKGNKKLGGHAATIAGYGLSKTPRYTEIEGVGGIYLRSSRIDELYAHDDQVGPFAKYLIDEISIGDGDKEQEIWSIGTSFSSEDGKKNGVRAYEKILTIPLYNKMRIAFDTVYKIIVSFNSFVEKAKKSFPSELGSYTHIEWDIRLTKVEQFKEDFLNQLEQSIPSKSEVLLKSMPKYIWRGTGRLLDGELIIDLLFDATDLEQGILLLNCICYEGALHSILQDQSEYLLQGMKDNGTISKKQVWQIFSWFVQNAKTS